MRAADQLTDELTHTLIATIEELCGTETAAQLLAAVTASAATVAERIIDGDAMAASAVMGLLYPWETTVPHEWWISSLGRKIAPLLPDGPLSHEQAAEMLDVGRPTIGSLIDRGDLDTVTTMTKSTGRPMRRVSRSSVTARMIRLDTKRGAFARKREAEESCAHGVGHPVRSRVEAVAVDDDEAAAMLVRREDRMVTSTQGAEL